MAGREAVLWAEEIDRAGLSVVLPVDGGALADIGGQAVITPSYGGGHVFPAERWSAKSCGSGPSFVIFNAEAGARCVALM